MDRRWLDGMRLLMYGLCSYLLPFAFFPGTFNNLQYQFENIVANGEHYLNLGNHVGVGKIAQVIQKFCGYSQEEIIANTPSWNHLFYYSLLLIAIFSIILAFFEHEKWKKYFLVILPILFIPKDSTYYNLLYLLPVLILLCNEQCPLAFLKLIVIILFVILFTPLRFIPGQNELVVALAIDFLSITIIVSSLKQSVLLRFIKVKNHVGRGSNCV